jgi:hypothetical protein
MGAWYVANQVGGPMFDLLKDAIGTRYKIPVCLPLGLTRENSSDKLLMTKGMSNFWRLGLPKL